MYESVDHPRIALKVENHLAIINSKGEFLALDNSSGDYPYIAKNISDIHFWSSLIDANKYAEMFSNNSYNFGQLKVVTIQLRVVILNRMS